MCTEKLPKIVLTLNRNVSSQHPNLENDTCKLWKCNSADWTAPVIGSFEINAKEPIQSWIVHRCCPVSASFSVPLLLATCFITETFFFVFQNWPQKLRILHIGICMPLMYALKCYIFKMAAIFPFFASLSCMVNRGGFICNKNVHFYQSKHTKRTSLWTFLICPV